MTATLLSSAMSGTPATLLVLLVLLILGMAVLGARRRPGNALRAADYAAKPLFTNW